MIGIVSIYFGTTKEEEIINVSKPYVGKFIGEWSGAIVMTLANYIISFILSYI